MTFYIIMAILTPVLFYIAEKMAQKKGNQF
jgi:hypothetical protein